MKWNNDGPIIHAEGDCGKTAMFMVSRFQGAIIQPQECNSMRGATSYLLILLIEGFERLQQAPSRRFSSEQSACDALEALHKVVADAWSYAYKR